MISNKNSFDKNLLDQIETTLGEGTFGKVLECRDVNTSKKYAVKVIRNIKRYREAAKLEINCLEKMEVLNKSKKR